MTVKKSREKLLKAEAAYIEAAVGYTKTKVEAIYKAVKKYNNGNNVQVYHRSRVFPMKEIKGFVEPKAVNIYEASHLRPMIEVTIALANGKTSDVTIDANMLIGMNEELKELY